MATHRTHVGAGVSVVVPRGWHLLKPRITHLAYPAERLVLTSYTTPPGGNCSPDRAERDLPADGALAYLFEYRPRQGAVWIKGMRRSDFPPRPARFTLRRRDLGNYECWRVPSYLIRFRAADRPFQLHVAIGPHTTPARRAQLLRALDSMHFSALPPPPRDPYAGWHELVDETGDTLRTPPGWMAAVTPSPRRRRQPRTLFITANRALPDLPASRHTRLRSLPRAIPAGTRCAFPRNGVLLWIREDTPGLATTAWPPLPDRPWPRPADFAPVVTGPAAATPWLHWRRAGSEQRHTRYSVWIVSGPDASAANRTRAIKAARRFGFSVGPFRNRACRHVCESGSPVRIIHATRDASG